MDQYEKSKREGKTEMATPRAVDGRMIRGGKGKRDTSRTHYRRLGIPSRNTAFDEAFKEQVNDCVKKTEAARSKVNGGTEELQRDFAPDEIEKIHNLTPQP